MGKTREKNRNRVKRARTTPHTKERAKLTRAVKAEAKVDGQSEQKLGGKLKQNRQLPNRPKPP